MCMDDLLDGYSCADVEDYWKKNVEGRNFVWVVVGDSKKIDMTALENFGPVTKLKPGEVMR